LKQLNENNLMKNSMSPEDVEVLSLVARKTINAVVITDLQHNILWVNEAYTTITGYTAEEAIGQPPAYAWQRNGVDPNTISYMAHKMAMGEDFECELLNYNKNGAPFWMRLQVQPVYNDAGKLTRYFALGTDITEHKKLRETLEEQNTRQHKEITRAIFKAEERERSEIGRELHDNVNQLLATVKLYLGNMRNTGKCEPEDLAGCAEYIDNAIHEIRMMTKRMMSPVSRSISLKVSLQQLVQTMIETSSLDISLETDGFEEDEVSHDCQQNLFRIVQEQLSNIIKYAGACSVKIQITTDANGIALTITDDGRGFDIKTSRKGVGLINILHRAEAFNGQAEIISSAGMGCVLRVNIPADASVA
jgi:PAS domain S-box-containing protein